MGFFRPLLLQIREETRVCAGSPFKRAEGVRGTLNHLANVQPDVQPCKCQQHLKSIDSLDPAM
jgi:hypothetical protein